MGIRIEAKEDIASNCPATSRRCWTFRRGVARGFLLAFSDGTLVHGRWIPGENACRFGIESEGTAMARITRHGLGEALDLVGKFDRITLACGAQMLPPKASAEGDDVLQLTFDIKVREGV